jgi:anthranilate synthase component 2
MILLLDNYDSFTYNLYQMLGATGLDILVRRNDALCVAEVQELKRQGLLTHIVISPGPGRPADAGICEQLILAMAGHLPILGVCLGHQAICEAFGARITHASQLMHGKTSTIAIDTRCSLFSGLPKRCGVARYHSLAADPSSMPAELRVIAEAKDGTVMAVEHRLMPEGRPLYGLQFHPESILTPSGARILENFLASGRAQPSARQPARPIAHQPPDCTHGQTDRHYHHH